MRNLTKNLLNIRNKRKILSFFIGSNGLRSGWCIILFLATMNLINYVLFLIVIPYLRRYNYLSPEFVILTKGASLFAVLGSTLIMGLIEGCNILSYGLRGPRIFQRFGWGTFWGLTLLSVLVGGLLATGHFVVEVRHLHDQSMVFYGPAWAIAFFVVALGEEALFRGYLQFTLARSIGFWPAGILLSVASGLVHLGNSGESGFGAFQEMLFAGILVLCLRLSGSLWWGIGFHAAWDWAESFLYGALDSGHPQVDGSLFTAHAIGDAFWSGGATGPEASPLDLLILCITLLVVIASFGGPWKRFSARR